MTQTAPETPTQPGPVPLAWRIVLGAGAAVASVGASVASCMGSVEPIVGALILVGLIVAVGKALERRWSR